MSKQRVKRLQFVLDMAEDKEKTDLKNWGVYQQRLLQEQEKLTQLEQYMVEYRSNLTSNTATSIRGGQVQNTIAFIEQIKDASGHQEQQINLIQQQVDGAQRVYLTSRSKAQALRQLIDKLNSQLSAVAEKQDQKLMDEFAARSARNRNV